MTGVPSQNGGSNHGGSHGGGTPNGDKGSVPSGSTEQNKTKNDAYRPIRMDNWLNDDSLKRFDHINFGGKDGRSGGGSRKST